MSKQFLTIIYLNMAAAVFFVQTSYAKNSGSTSAFYYYSNKDFKIVDSASSRNAVMDIINTVVKASGTFDIDAVANLYTPNAVIADEEPPFSWNGPTAGVQWVSTVEKTCKDFKLKEFKGKIGHISVYLQTDESIYVVVPVEYTGSIKENHFEEDGAFTFVFRMVSGHWLIKSQVWMARKGL
jgi:ketosteroid isomerase-like protein